MRSMMSSVALRPSNADLVSRDRRRGRHHSLFECAAADAAAVPETVGSAREDPIQHFI